MIQCRETANKTPALASSHSLRCCSASIAPKRNVSYCLPSSWICLTCLFSTVYNGYSRRSHSASCLLLCLQPSLSSLPSKPRQSIIIHNPCPPLPTNLSFSHLWSPLIPFLPTGQDSSLLNLPSPKKTTTRSRIPKLYKGTWINRVLPTKRQPTGDTKGRDLFRCYAYLGFTYTFDENI